MPFAVFYSRADLERIAAEVTRPDLAPQERVFATKLWEAGLKDWESAPYAGDEFACVDIPFEPVEGEIDPDKTWSRNPDGTWRVCDPTVRVVVLSGVGVTKQSTAAWLRLVAGKGGSATYMSAVAKDIGLTAVEPWPRA